MYIESTQISSQDQFQNPVDPVLRLQQQFETDPAVRRLHQADVALQTMMAQKLQEYCQNLRLSPKRKS